ncbi:MAG: hypothetical protein VCB43_15150, partial [Myxococcota bacterium]
MTVEQPFGFLKSGFTHRGLIARLGWRRIEARYRGSFAGVGWLLLQPVLMLGIDTLVFLGCSKPGGVPSWKAPQSSV